MLMVCGSDKFREEGNALSQQERADSKIDGWMDRLTDSMGVLGKGVRECPPCLSMAMARR